LLKYYDKVCEALIAIAPQERGAKEFC